jgi:hypothetical protein
MLRDRQQFVLEEHGTDFARFLQDGTTDSRHIQMGSEERQE